MHTRIFKSHAVDITKRPAPCPEFSPDTDIQVTMGDLHGNTLKLIHFLIFNHIMAMRTRSCYSRFVKIYQKKSRRNNSGRY